METGSAGPVILVEIGLGAGGGTLYLSDRTVEVGGVWYEDYVEEVLGVGDAQGRADGACLSGLMEVVFRNHARGGYGYLIEMDDEYPFEGARVVLRECRARGDGGAEVVYVGVLEEPREIDLLRFRCGISPREAGADRLWR